MRGFRTTIAAVACCAAALAGAASRTAAATWTDKVTTTPSLVQTNFGRFGDRLPLNGEISCGETAIAMSLLWLGENGFTQLAPAKPTREDGLQLIRIFTGMAEAPTGGSLVDEDWYRYAVTTYLGLKGVGENQYHWERQIGPSVAWLEEHNQNQSFVNFAVGWYVPDANEPGVWDRTGQHWLTLLATDPEAGTLTINNPYPAAFFAVPNLPSQNPQAIPTIPFTAGTLPPLPFGTYIQTDVPLANPDAGVLAVLETGYSFTIDEDARPAAGWTPQPFSLAGLRYVNNYTAPLEVLAPLTGPGGLQKYGPADLILTNDNTTTGDNEVREGLIATTRSSGTPFGTGRMSLFDSGGLALRPGSPAGPPVLLLVATGPNSTFQFGHGARLELDRGDHTFFETIVGGNVDGVTTNLVRLAGGSLAIQPHAPLRELGDTTRLLVSGNGGNLPEVTNGIVHPSIVAQSDDALRSGSFLTFGPHGFEAAETVSSRDQVITSADDMTVYALDNDQIVRSGETATVFALQGGPHLLRTKLPSRRPGPIPPTTLRVGDALPEHEAGIILNGTVLALDRIELGASEGVVYTSRADGWIFSDIAGTGGLTLFGPGTLHLLGNNAYSGSTVVSSGTVIVSNRTGPSTGLGTGEVAVNANGHLVVQGATAKVDGPIFVSQDSTLTLAGGTIGDVEVQYGGYLIDGGVLEGFGTVAGEASLAGTLRAGPELGVLRFTQRARFNTDFSTAFVYWTLAALDDTPGNEGRSWNALDFPAGASVGTEDNPVLVLIEFRGIPGPDSGHPFWQSRHRWLFATFSADHDWEIWDDDLNFDYAAGSFCLQLEDDRAFMAYVPKPATCPG